MSGFTRDQAAQLLQLGWSQQQVREAHDYLKDWGFGSVVTRMSSWGLLINDHQIFYRGVPVVQQWRRWQCAVAPTDGTIAYTDGSGTTDSKEAGIGVALYQPGFAPLLVAEHIGKGSNNRAELSALWRAMRLMPDVQAWLHVLSDSEYAVGSVTRDWQPQKHRELIAAVREDLAWRDHHVTFEHVEGHAGVEGNEIADGLSKIGRKHVTMLSEFLP